MQEAMGEAMCKIAFGKCMRNRWLATKKEGNVVLVSRKVGHGCWFLFLFGGVSFSSWEGQKKK